MVALEIMMILSFFILIGMQRRSKPIVREIATVFLFVITMAVYLDYQLNLYVCNSDQRNIAKSVKFAAADDDLSWMREAANNYLGDADNPYPAEINYRSYFDAIDRLDNRPSIYYD